MLLNLFKKYFEYICFILGIVLFVSGLIFTNIFLFLASCLLIGGDIFLRAGKNILKGEIFDENFLMSLAVIGAFAIGEYPEGCAVMLFYKIGEKFQDFAVDNSRKSISKLMDIRPDYVNLKSENEIKKVFPDEVNVGDYIIIKPGEKVPIDGIIIKGQSYLDVSSLTGESIPREVLPGSEVLSGSVNQNGLLTVKVTKSFGESTVSKILDLVQNAENNKAKTENFITKFARYYTPAVVFAALALAVIPPIFIADSSFSVWIHRALVFLVVSCPCALVISIPLGFFAGIGGASKNGILVKGGNYLEALNNAGTVIFDKTGTLTKGVFGVTEIIAAENIFKNKEELLYYAAHAEYNSTHPIAVSILKYYKDCGNNIFTDKIEKFEESAGLGIKAVINQKTILAGNNKFFDYAGINYINKNDLSGTAVYIAADNIFAGYIIISDEIKKDSKTAVKKLKNLGIKKIAMFTGDSKTAGEKIGRELGLSSVFAELLPHQKVEKFNEIKIKEKNRSGKNNIIFVGDGINDAPILAASDIGFAMGGVGSDAAIEAADIVLMTDEPSKIAETIQIAKKTRRIVLQNIIFALGVKFIVLILGALGIASMWAAVFADVGVAFLAILNAMRAMKI